MTNTSFLLGSMIHCMINVVGFKKNKLHIFSYSEQNLFGKFVFYFQEQSIWLNHFNMAGSNTTKKNY